MMEYPGERRGIGYTWIFVSDQIGIGIASIRARAFLLSDPSCSYLSIPFRHPSSYALAASL